MLNELAKADDNNLQILDLMALNAWQQQQFAVAIASWQKMLRLLPTGDARIPLIESSIEQAKSASGQQKSQLGLRITLSAVAEKMLPQGRLLYISVSDGNSPVPVAVKKFPLSHFPLSLTLDDSNAMLPQRLLSAQHQIQVRVRISRDGGADSQPGDWFGLSAVTPFNGQQQLTVDINQQVTGNN